jgi:hypothetical protein
MGDFAKANDSLTGMTVAEVIVLIGFGVLIYWVLSPLRRRLEAFIYGFLRTKSHRQGPTIDVTPIKKQENKNGDH